MSECAEEIFDDVTNAIGGVRAELLMPVWPKAQQVLRRAVKPVTGYTMEAVLNELQTGHMQLWVINDFQGVVVTQIKVLPLHRVLWVMFIAGDHMDEWLDDWIAVQEAYARHNECVAVEFSGRQGWNKIAKRHREYRPTWTIFRRELDHGQ